MINEAWVFFSKCFQFIYFYVFFIYLSTIWTIFADFLMKMRRFLRMNVVLEKFFFWHVKTIGPGGSLRSKHLPRSWGCVTDKTGVKKETDAVSNDHRGRLIGILWYDKYKFFFFTDIVFALLASSQVVFFMESMMEHVAKELKLTPEQVRKVNLYQNGQVRLRIKCGHSQ